MAALARTISTGSFEATPRMYELVREVMQSGRISYGDKSLRLEQEFSALHGCRYGILSNSGTSSLAVALQALKEEHRWGKYGEVIIPATTFVATANVVFQNGLVPVLCDVEPVGFGIDAEQIARLIRPSTVAIMPVHIGGQACDMGIVRYIADKHGLKVCEDSCEAMFVQHTMTHGPFEAMRYAGITKPVGAWGDIACFSFYVAHLLVAGVGGISTTNNPRYASRMRSLVNHGLSLDNLNPDENFAPRPMLNRRFTFSSQGHSYRITEFEAALALAQLEDYQVMLKTRRANANALTQMLEPYQDELSLPQTLLGNTHSWMFYTLVTKREDKRELMAHLAAHGVECRDLPSLLYQPCYSWDADKYPVSKHLATHAFYTGTHQGLTVDDMRYVADVIANYYEHRA